MAGKNAALLIHQHRVRPARTRPSRRRAGPPAPRCACAGSVRRGAVDRSATARSDRRAPPARLLAMRRSTANLVVRTWARTWRDACRGHRSSEPQGFCGFRPDQSATGGANLGCDGGRPGSHPSQPGNPRNSAAYGGFSANLSATGATGRFAPRRGSKRQEICGFQAVGCDGWVRTANPEFAACR